MGRAMATVGMTPSGSFAKGTANQSGTDIDLLAVRGHSSTLKQIYDMLWCLV